MSSPFDQNRPGGNGGGNEPTDQWRPVDGEAWSNAPDGGSGSWGFSGGPGGQGAQGGYPAGPAGPAGYQGGPGGYGGYQGGPGGPGGYQGGSGGPGGFQGGPAGYPGSYPPMGGASAAGGSGGGNGGKVALIILVALLIVAAGGALGYFLLADRGDGGSGLTVQPETIQTDAPATEAPGRAEGFVAPASWGLCGGSGEPGDLNLYYAGTSSTSCPFTEAVRNALVDHYNSTDRLDGTITAYSPVTGQTYSMSCTDEGDYVTCRGGRNAVVHVV